MNKKIEFDTADPWLGNFKTDAMEDVYRKENKTVYQYVYEKNKEHIGEYALRYFGRRITYGTFFEMVEMYAKAFSSYGIQRGDYVTLCLPNIPETVYFFYALCRLGATANLIDPRMNPQGIVDKVTLSKSRLFVTVVDICREKVDGIMHQLSVEHVLVVSPTDSLTWSGQFPKEAFLKLFYAKKEYETKTKGKRCGKYIFLKEFLDKYYNPQMSFEEEYIPDTPVCVTYTSGTTGTPKGAQFTNEAVIAQNKNMHYGADIFNRQDTFLGIIPMFSAYGLICGVNVAMCCGWETILVPAFNPLKFDELIVKHRPNNVIGVPRFWETIIDSRKINKTDLSFLNIAIAGGDKVTPAVLEKINEMFLKQGAKIKLKLGYGSTELGGAIATTLDKSCYEPGSVGSVLPGTKVKIIDPETGKELSYLEDGEICANSPTQMQAYLNNFQETENILYTDENGNRYYRTGDKGHLTEYGILFVVDRYKRLMKRPDGHQVHASPIENVLNTHEAVSAAAVAGIPQTGKESGIIPVAFVIKKAAEADDNRLAHLLDDYCKERIAHRDVPLAYVFVDKLPYTPMGKVDFKKLGENRFDSMDAVIVDHTFFR